MVRLAIIFFMIWETGLGKCQVRNRQALLDFIKVEYALDQKQFSMVKSIFFSSSYLGQGNIKISDHPICEETCRQEHRKTKVTFKNKRFKKICAHDFMAPLYDPVKEKAEDASTCIDQFEFPNRPCSFPIVWVRAREAAQICHALGKRLCDAHEWEGACAGALRQPDYRFDLVKKDHPKNSISRMRQLHNAVQKKSKVWSYGNQFQKRICAQDSKKSRNCNGGDWLKCGSNTYPTGYFSGCHSKLDVFDLHGNAAEHMNLPLSMKQLAPKNLDHYGYTEMKGSWFIWDKYRAHPDHCRWRAPFWHGSQVMSQSSHRNYHLGFRCCLSRGGGDGS